MENLLTYLYSRHINSKDPHAQTFCRLKSITTFNLSQEELEFYSSMLIRNFFTYSAANMEIKLSPKHLLSLHRLHKFEALMRASGVGSLFEQWVGNELMPFVEQSNKVPANNPYVYVDSKEEEKDDNKNK